MNLLKLLRFSNLMSPTVPNRDGALMPQMGQDNPSFDSGIAPFNPEHTASDRLNQVISQQPTRNHPGLIRKLAAGAYAGLGGDGEKLLYAPYDRAMADWNAKLKPVENAASLERQSNA